MPPVTITAKYISMIDEPFHSTREDEIDSVLMDSFSRTCEELLSSGARRPSVAFDANLEATPEDRCDYTSNGSTADCDCKEDASRPSSQKKPKKKKKKGTTIVNGTRHSNTVAFPSNVDDFLSELGGGYSLVDF